MTSSKANMHLPNLETAGLAVGYDGKAVVADVEIRVSGGQVVTLIGPNGAGKSTVLKTVAGQLAAVGGCVYVAGRPLAGLSPRELAAELSVMLTDRVHTELLTCADVVEAGRYPHTGRLGILDDEDRAVVRASMEQMRVWDLRDRDFMQVSDGQRQRVLLARAFCQQPSVLVLDEPTNYLDIRYQIDLLNALRRFVRDNGAAVLMSLHELPLARRVSDYVLCVKDGRVCAQGTPAEMFIPQVIDDLYDLEPGTYDPSTGDVSLQEAN